MEDFDLIFIAGGGHSGSTLLDLIIGTSPEVFGLGEACFFNSYNYDIYDSKLYQIYKKKCSCGKEFQNCDFWNQVKAEAGKELDIGRTYSIAQNFKFVWNIICPVKKLRFDVSNPDDLKFLNSVLAVKSRKESQINFLLDSSKDPRRLLRLEKTIKKKNLKVIFLVRDIKGYVNSYSNPNKWRVKDAGLKPQNFLRVACRWVVVNTVIRLYLAIHGINYIKIVYDDFCINLDENLNKIQNKWGVKIPPNYIDRIRETEYHNIHGNLMKFSSIEKIELDKSWQQQLPKWKKALITFLFGWANYLYTYSK